MSADVLLTVLGAASWLAGFACWLAGRRDLMWAFFALCNVLLAAEFAIGGSWWLAGLWSLFAINAAWFWHDERRKRGRKNAAALLGEKSRALRDALVRKAREAAQPRPVLRPSLGGAR